VSVIFMFHFRNNSIGFRLDLAPGWGKSIAQCEFYFGPHRSDESHDRQEVQQIFSITDYRRVN
jgi:hypothetical protein